MFKMLSAAIPVSLIFATLVGCAEKPVLVDNGPVRILILPSTSGHPVKR